MLGAHSFLPTVIAVARFGRIRACRLCSGPALIGSIFYSHEPNELPHIHVDREDLSAKFWLEPVQLARNFGFRANELRTIQSVVTEHREEFLEAWNEFFGAAPDER